MFYLVNILSACKSKQVATFDGWGEIARFHFDEEGAMQLVPTVFFMTFLLVVSFTLLPVVVAGTNPAKSAIG